MRYICQLERDVCIITISGEFVVTKLEEFANFIDSFFTRKQFKAVIINFKLVEMVDSTGVGMIILLQRELKETQTKLVVTHLKNKFKDCFSAIQSNCPVVFYPTEEAALVSLKL